MGINIKEMGKIIAIIESQTIGTPTEIYEVLTGGIKGKYDIHLVDSESSIKTLTIEKITNFPDMAILPKTRKERRKQQRSSHK